MRQNKNTRFYIGGSGLDQTDDFQKFCGSGLDRIQFNRIRTGLGLKNFTVRSSLMHTSALQCSSLAGRTSSMFQIRGFPYSSRSSTSFGDTMHLVGSNLSMQPTQLWSVDKSTFLHDVYL